MTGFEHQCALEKTIILEYKKALSESLFSFAQIDMIWDFYVTHALGGSSGQKRELTDYGWKKTETGQGGYKELESALIEKAGIEKICFIRAKTCNDTLMAMDLANDRICVDHPRAVLLQNFTTTVDENERIRFAGGGENRIDCLFRHLRNAFAHGNTYFFENGTALLEDKEGQKTTAKILVKQQTLLDWIMIVDKEQQYYVLKDPCSTCKNGEKQNGTPDI